MSGFKKRSLKTMSVLYRTLFVDKVDTVYIGDVRTVNSTGKVDKEAIHEMRKAFTKPVSVLRSRPKLDGTGGFVAHVAEKHGKTPRLNGAAPPVAASSKPLTHASSILASRIANDALPAEAPTARSIFTPAPSTKLPVDPPTASAARLVKKERKSLPLNAHASESTDAKAKNAQKSSKHPTASSQSGSSHLSYKYAPMSALPGIPLNVTMLQDSRASLPGVSHYLDMNREESNEMSPFPTTVDFRKAATRVRSSFASTPKVTQAANMRVRLEKDENGIPHTVAVSEDVSIPNEHNMHEMEDDMDNDADFMWDEEDRDALDAFMPRIMCLDIGVRTIGVSMSAADYKKAIPITTIKTTIEIDDVDELQALLENKRELHKTMNDREGRIYRKKTPLELALELNQLRREYNVIACVVGRPIPPPGESDGLGRFIENFVGDMQKMNGLGKGFQVLFWDEYGSTKRARGAMRALGMEVDRNITLEQAKAAVAQGKPVVDAQYQARKGQLVDMFAACAILEDFLKVFAQVCEMETQQEQQHE